MLSRVLAQHDIWHVEAGHMRTCVLCPSLTAHPEVVLPWDTYEPSFPVLRRVSSTRGGARRDRWRVALVAPGGRLPWTRHKNAVGFSYPSNPGCALLVLLPLAYLQPRLQEAHEPRG